VMCLTDALYISFVVNKMPEDGTLLPEHVGVGTSYEVCFIICFSVF